MVKYAIKTVIYKSLGQPDPKLVPKHTYLGHLSQIKATIFLLMILITSIFRYLFAPVF